MESKTQFQEFVKVFPELLECFAGNTEIEDMPETNDWLIKVMKYNVPHGKLTRGLTVPETYRLMARDNNRENRRLSYILGWCMEILQASFLIGDDIMDGSEMRRGKPCWYKVENNGVAAFNDTILLENVVYKLLKLYFGTKPYYVDLMEIFHETVLKTAYGQSLDTRSSLENNIDSFTLNLFKQIVKYKTSFYSFYTPIKLAMTMAGMKNDKVFAEVENMCFEIGYMFQVQDDYLDCFGDFEVTGKVGTDIEDGKCTWLFVTAMEKGTPQEKFCLKEMYRAKKVEHVKEMYIQLKVREAYRDFEEEMYNKILHKAESLPGDVPKEILTNLANKIYRRNK